MRRLVLLLASTTFIACDEPPTREIAAAETQLESARTTGAERYAPERFREASAALEAARQHVQKKDYREALSSARAAAERARMAAQGAAAARTLARGAAAVTKAEIQATLEDAEAVVKEALSAKIPERAFEPHWPRLQAASDDLKRLNELLDGGDALEAREAAAALKAQIADLPAAFREARLKWETEHPKGRPRRH